MWHLFLEEANFYEKQLREKFGLKGFLISSIMFSSLSLSFSIITYDEKKYLKRNKSLSYSLWKAFENIIFMIVQLVFKQC